ncbi:GNAT family N-acetyltransferase [Streptomyces tubbatahanensis]|uniref:GNAT family N-acetyltransferase n=1 Tax=Streptomyces tubbatahanensis TaxID=2923272 RepID=A0ABY3XMN7_9ACTN|nr:GNAT family N-acetyltransferase [Streptomyces tubbatahanensis]UNS95670.1 GNAT family N-acetyltransferase [Streptomyces tubbatahanensis]
MSELSIRPAGEGDIDQVLAFWREAAEGTSVSDDREGVGRLIARDPEALLLAEHDGQLVGTVIAGCGGTSRPEAGGGWRCSLYRLAVLPSHRRRGVSRRLLAAAEARFAALGGRRGDAMVLDDNERAHRAWEAAGYAPQPLWSRWVKTLPG